MRTKVEILLAVLTALIVYPVSGQGQPGESFGERLENYHSSLHPQKVYLHLDKSSYSAEETIWFKAYLFDGITNQLETRPANLYVELINRQNDAVDMRILLIKNGIAHGDIELPSGISDGNYAIKAYTDWMKNFSDDYYYTRYVYIQNTDYKNVIPRREVTRNRRFNRKLDKLGDNYLVAFFPESGNFLEGTGNRIAFKVVDEKGRGKMAEGEIRDRSGNTLTAFQTDFSGIGLFEITPEPGNKYYARISVEGERHRNFALPEVSSEGYAIRIDHSDDKIDVDVFFTVGRENPMYSDKLTLLGHTRGKPHYDTTFYVSGDRMNVTIDKGSFPMGITHFTLFTGNNVPVAERLVYIDQGDELYFDTNFSTKTVNGREYLDLNFFVTDENKEPVAGSFSVSAVTGKPDEGAQTDNILSYILLNSDISEMVEDPSTYLYAKSGQDVSVDHLLMTYGWRRFKWDNVVAGNLPEIRFESISGLNLNGLLSDPAKDEPLSNYPVKLLVKNNKPDVYETFTGRNGLFNFKDLYYSGLFEIQLSSRRLPENYPPVIKVNINEGRKFGYDIGAYTKEQDLTSRGDDWERVRGIGRSNLSLLNQRPVTPQIYGTPDQTIFIDYEFLVERSLFDVLRNRATGFTYDGNQIILRGRTSLLLSNEPRFMVDGVFVDRDVLLNLNPENVERIEIFKGTRAAIFGVRGGTGVILAYSRRPGYRGFEDVTELVMLGYHAPREFYSDLLPFKGISKDEKENTLHWEPLLESGDDGRINVQFPVNKAMGNIKITLEGAGFEKGIGFAEFTVGFDD